MFVVWSLTPWSGSCGLVAAWSDIIILMASMVRNVAMV